MDVDGDDCTMDPCPSCDGTGEVPDQPKRFPMPDFLLKRTSECEEIRDRIKSDIKTLNTINEQLAAYKLPIHRSNATAQKYVRDVEFLLKILKLFSGNR